MSKAIETEDVNNHEFRAWDGSRFVYLSEFTIGLGKNRHKEKNDRSPYVMFEKDTFGDHVSLRSHEITQYSGINDKNGEKLFAGDVIENDAARFLVVFNRGCFCARIAGRPPRETELALRGVVDVRKVGNIFENPELVEVKDGK